MIEFLVIQYWILWELLKMHKILTAFLIIFFLITLFLYNKDEKKEIKKVKKINYNKKKWQHIDDVVKSLLK